MRDSNSVHGPVSLETLGELLDTGQHFYVGQIDCDGHLMTLDPPVEVLVSGCAPYRLVSFGSGQRTIGVNERCVNQIGDGSFVGGVLSGLLSCHHHDGDAAISANGI